jgi:hypothetical protein
VTSPTQDLLSFEQLRDQIVSAAGSAVEIGIGQVAGDLASALSNYLGLATLRLQQFRMLEQGEAAVRLASTINLPTVGNPGRKVDVGVDARFWRAGSGIGYTIVFAISPAAARAMLGDLGRVLDALPVQMNGLWLSLSSDKRGALRIETPGLELEEALVEAGRGYLFRLRGQLLEKLGLDQTVFYLANFPDSLRFETKASVTIPIGSLIQFTIKSISIEGAQAITFSGEGALDFFGQKVIFLAAIRLTAGAIAFEIDLGRFVPHINHPFFRPLTFTRAVASIEGTLASYAVGVSGDFEIAGSGNGGKFLVKYATGASTPVPDLFELESNQLILSDLATLATGVPIKLPPFLDRVISLKNSYVYYAKVPGLITLSGVPSVTGVKGHSNVSLLGYKAYGEVTAVAGTFAANFQFAPIKLDSILEISGSGKGSPPGYSGNGVGKNAIMVVVDAGNHTAAASLKVRFLGQASIDTIGALNDGSLNFVVKTKLPAPLGETSFSVELGHDMASIMASIHMAVGVKADWGWGKFSIANAAQVEADLKIVASTSGATGRADVRASLGPVKLAFPIDFDPLDMAGLVARIQKEVAEQIIKALEDSVMWLRAVLDGTIKFAMEAAQLAEAIGEELRTVFKHTAEQAAAALRTAGYDVNNAYLVLERGFEAGYENLRDLLQEAGGYAEQVVVDWLRDVCKADVAKFTARTMADIMLRAGYGTDRAIREVQKLLNDVKVTAEVLGQLIDSPREVARFLMNAKVGVQQAAAYLAEGFYRLTEEALKATLVDTGYAAKEVGQAVGNVWRESGRALGNLRDELGRFWRRYEPRVTVRWRVKL